MFVGLSFVLFFIGDAGGMRCDETRSGFMGGLMNEMSDSNRHFMVVNSGGLVEWLWSGWWV
jgi:hypothetical protein